MKLLKGVSKEKSGLAAREHLWEFLVLLVALNTNNTAALEIVKRMPLAVGKQGVKVTILLALPSDLEALVERKDARQMVAVKNYLAAPIIAAVPQDDKSER